MEGETTSSTECILRVMVVHEDSVCQRWAVEVRDQVADLVGPRCLRSSLWPFSDLAQSRLLNAAVRAAVEADVIVLSLRLGAAIPLPLEVWIEAWLPRRLQPTGTLVALLGMPEPLGPNPPAVPDYLRAVARQARLDFLPQQRALPAEGWNHPSLAQPTTHALQGLLRQPPGARRDWGINE